VLSGVDSTVSRATPPLLIEEGTVSQLFNDHLQQGMRHVQLAHSHLQQELHEDRASLGMLPCCHNLEVYFESVRCAEGRGIVLIVGWLCRLTAR